MVFDDVGPMCPLRGTVADLLAPGRRPDRAEGFGDGDVDVGVREVREPTDVVHVEVGNHDVADVFSAEAEAFDLVCGGLHVVEQRPDDMSRRPNAVR